MYAYVNGNSVNWSSSDFNIQIGTRSGQCSNSISKLGLQMPRLVRKPAGWNSMNGR